MVEFPLLLVCNVSFLECIHLICTISCYILRLPQSAGIVSAARQVDGFRRFPKPCKEPPKQGLLSKETCPALSFIIPHFFQPLCFAKKMAISNTAPTPNTAIQKLDLSSKDFRPMSFFNSPGNPHLVLTL